MVEVDLKRLLKRLNGFCTQSLEASAGLCVSRTHYEVTIEHLLLKLAEAEQADLALVLRHFGVDGGRLRKSLQQDLEKLKTGNAGRPVFSPLLIDWFREAWILSSLDLEQERIRSGALLAALLSSPRLLPGECAKPLEGIRPDEFKARFSDIVSGSIEEEARPFGADEAAAPASPSRHGPETALGRFTIDFTARARAGGIDPVFARDKEIRQMIDILARRRKNNPIAVGEPGVGKTAVIEGLALKVAEGDVPDILKDVDILSLDMGLLQAGAGVKGEFENRLKSVIAEVKESPRPIILFIDEAHTLIGAGGAAGGGDAANLLKPALARGELRTIAATTWSEYKKYFEKDAALARRFQLVKLEEPTVEDTITILRGLRGKYEESHGVEILDEAIVAAARMASRYIAGRQQPDKGVDLIDTTAARVKVSLTTKPAGLSDKEVRIRTLEREREALLRDRDCGHPVEEERLAVIEEEVRRLQDEAAALEAAWRSEREIADRIIALRRGGNGRGAGSGGTEADAGAPDPEESGRKKELEEALKELAAVQGDRPLVKLQVDTEAVAAVVADWTGIPIGRMLQDEAGRLLRLEKDLGERIRGQDHVLEIVAKGIRASKAGLQNPNSPMGVFLFVGPSGVGKTECALSVADLLFGGERFLTTINMSEFQEKHTVSRLIGSPPGYVGFGEGGVLTEAVRQRPYSVVLLDEVEKADPEVMNLFYQVFDKGMLADGEGRVVDFKNTVVFLTSNLASDVITEMGMAEDPADPETLIEAIRPILNRHFKPALVARMTIVPFRPLRGEALKEIVKLKLDRLGARLAATHRMRLDLDPAVVDEIAARCTEVDTGARNIDHIISGTLLPRISTEILRKMSEGGLPESLALGLDGTGEFSFRFGP